MRPYYEHAGIAIYHGDCLAALAEVAPVSVGCLLMDPPYCSGGYLEAQKNTKAQGLRGATVRAEDFVWFASDNMGTAGLAWLLRSVMLEARRILRPNRSAFVFTDWRMIPSLAPALESSGLRYRNMLVWDKLNAGLGVGFKPAHEIIMEFCNGSTEYQGLTGQNVLRVPRVPACDKEHGAQKPVGLVRQILATACPAGELVVDPFMGSGTTLDAARSLGMRAVGVDLSERNCEIAAQLCLETL
jgi:DNA modification methylase